MASRSRSATTSPRDVRTAGPVSSGPLAAGLLAEADNGLLTVLSTRLSPVMSQPRTPASGSALVRKLGSLPIVNEKHYEHVAVTQG